MDHVSRPLPREGVGVLSVAACSSVSLDSSSPSALSAREQVLRGTLTGDGLLRDRHATS